ncbi:hypothetical protein A2U01_0025476, partial [Trifolium medium]|nr:hypothetical protein [Trifolium medium]
VNIALTDHQNDTQMICASNAEDFDIPSNSGSGIHVENSNNVGVNFDDTANSDANIALSNHQSEMQMICTMNAEESDIPANSGSSVNVDNFNEVDIELGDTANSGTDFVVWLSKI